MSTTLTLNIKVNKSVTDTVKASKDGSYKECITGTVIPPPFNSSNSSVTVTTKTKGSGECFFNDSKFGVSFATIEGIPMGYGHFHETNSSGKWTLHSASSKNGFLIDIRTDAKNNFTITIELAAS